MQAKLTAAISFAVVLCAAAAALPSTMSDPRRGSDTGCNGLYLSKNQGCGTADDAKFACQRKFDMVVQAGGKDNNKFLFRPTPTSPCKSDTNCKNETSYYQSDDKCTPSPTVPN